MSYVTRVNCFEERIQHAFCVSTFSPEALHPSADVTAAAPLSLNCGLEGTCSRALQMQQAFNITVASCQAAAAATVAAA
jgi:hypothetical protein